MLYNIDFRIEDGLTNFGDPRFVRTVLEYTLQPAEDPGGYGRCRVPSDVIIEDFTVVECSLDIEPRSESFTDNWLAHHLQEVREYILGNHVSENSTS